MIAHWKIDVLFVEDSPVDAFLLREGLSKLLAAGAALLQAERLSEALAFVRQHTPDLILTDLNLPDSFGAETLQALVKVAGDTPVLALVGNDTPEIQAQLREAGASGQILKSDLMSPVLVETIEHVLRCNHADRVR